MSLTEECAALRRIAAPRLPSASAARARVAVRRKLRLELRALDMRLPLPATLSTPELAALAQRIRLARGWLRRHP